MSSQEDSTSVSTVQVLLPTFNNSPTLQTFLDSLVSQKDVLIDLLVSDDGSTDTSIALLKSYESRLNSLKIVAGPKKGIDKNYFHLLDLADGEFVAFANAAEIWEPNHLITSLQILSPHAQMPALTSAYQLNMSRFQSKKLQITKDISRRSDNRTLEYWLLNSPLRTGSIVINKKALKKLKNLDHVLAVDPGWWITSVIFLTGVVIPNDGLKILHPILRSHGEKKSKSTWNVAQGLFRERQRFIDQVPLQIRSIYRSLGVQIDTDKRNYVENLIHRPRIRQRLRRNFWMWINREGQYSYQELALLGLNTFAHSVMNLPNFINRSARFLHSRGGRFYRKATSILSTKFRKKERAVFLSSAEKLKIEQVNSQLNSTKFAVLAFFPRGSLLDSNLRLIKNLLNSHYNVIVVVNQGPLIEQWNSAFSSLPITVLNRQNIGLDFGAYKCGIAFLMEKFPSETISELLLANDSVVYGNNFANFFARFENDTSPWRAAFVNFEIHTHAQSFFQSFSGEIVNSLEFKSFWQSYYPSNNKIHAINNGEVRLSQTLIKAGFSPSSTVSAQVLLESIGDSPIRQIDTTVINGKDSFPYKNYEWEFQFELSRAFCERNVTHRAGMLSSKFLGAPLKLDLYRRLTATLPQIEETLLDMHIAPEEVSSILRDYL